MPVSLAWLSAITLLQHRQRDDKAVADVTEIVGHGGRSSNSHRTTADLAQGRHVVPWATTMPLNPHHPLNPSYIVVVQQHW
jgi:hypothetical protein